MFHFAQILIRAENGADTFLLFPKNGVKEQKKDTIFCGKRTKMEYFNRKWKIETVEPVPMEKGTT
jgi:hypothetical protein